MLDVREAIQGGCVTTSIRFGSSARGRDHILCGERLTCTLMLAFAPPFAALLDEATARSLSARLDSFSVELCGDAYNGRRSPAGEGASLSDGADDRVVLMAAGGGGAPHRNDSQSTISLDGQASTLSTLQRMRSVESLTLHSAESLDIDDDDAGRPAGPSAGREFAIGRLLEDAPNVVVIPIDFLADSEASFSRAMARLSFSIYQERADDSLKAFLKEPRMGARLLVSLLEESVPPGALAPASGRTRAEQCCSIFEPIDAIHHSIPIIRPLEAQLDVVKKEEDGGAIIALHLRCRCLAPPTSFTITEAALVIGDSSGHAMSHAREGLNRGAFLISPLACTLPAVLGGGETYVMLFEAHLLPLGDAISHPPLEEGDSLKMRVELKVLAGPCAGAASRGGESSPPPAAPDLIHVAFECDFAMEEMFQSSLATSDKVSLAISCMTNATSPVHSLFRVALF